MTDKLIQLKTIYQIKITLRYSDPPIWRRFQVGSDITLGELHLIIQNLMWWWGEHLHEFRVGNIRYAPPSKEPGFFNKSINEDNVKLNTVMKNVEQVVIYEYDFGDSWEHELRLEQIRVPEEGVRYPVCLQGERCCPPEDCGGIGRYQYMLEILKDPEHLEYEEIRDQTPEGHDPEKFDLDRANEAIRAVKLGHKAGRNELCPCGSGKKFKKCCGVVH